MADDSDVETLNRALDRLKKKRGKLVLPENML